MIRAVTTSSIGQHQLVRLVASRTASRAAAVVARKEAFTGAALSEYYYGGDNFIDVADTTAPPPPSSSSEEEDATAFSAYASNGFLSPLLRRQLDLCGSGGGDQSQKQPSSQQKSPASSSPPSTSSCLHQDFAEEERVLIQQRTAAMHTLAMADDDDVTQQQQLEEDEDSSMEMGENCAEDSQPLPRTFAAATHPSESRPIVITESASPFRIVHVNSAWEGLCGYTRAEASGKTLGDLLGGPQTDGAAATALVTALMRGEEEAGTVLTNYKKGDVEKSFRNRVRVGPLRNGSGGGATHFVNVLREMTSTRGNE